MKLVSFAIALAKTAMSSMGNLLNGQLASSHASYKATFIQPPF